MYKLTNTSMILRQDGAYIPADPNNVDYAEYLTWVAAGNTPEPVDAPTIDQLWTAFQQQAQSALDFDDAVAIRCIKAGVAYPPTWLARDIALRTIVASVSGDPTQPLPAQPVSFPDGT